jgi:protein TonB
VFTKIGLPITKFHFLESSPAPILGNISHGGGKRGNERPWIALGLVLCAHLSIFAALRPQPQPLAVETIPEPITVSLLSAPEAAPQKPVSSPPPAATPMEKTQKPVKKPIKTPVRKPVMPRVKKASLPVTPPSVERAAPPEAAPSPAVAPQATTATNTTPTKTKTTNAKVADAPSYQSPSFNAAYLNNPAPNYPSVSRRLGEEGLVLLRVQVTANGLAGSVELQTGSGSSRLDQAALEAVKKWRFIPAKRGEQPVSASVSVPVRFSIEG